MPPIVLPDSVDVVPLRGQRAVPRLVGLHLLALLAASCGGGGGGSDPPPPPLSLSPSSVSATAIEGESANLSTTITLDAQVDTSNGVYLRIGRNAAVFSEADINGISPTVAVFTLQTVPTLSVGDHAGGVEFLVCKDSTCAQKYSDVPVTLSYQITVTPAPPPAEITPSTLTSTTEVGDSFQIVITAQIRSGVSASAFAIEDPLGRFLSTVEYSQLSGGPLRYTVTLRGRALGAVGTYAGTLNLIVCRTTPCSMATKLSGSPIPMTYVVTVTPPLLEPIPTLTGLPEWETYQGNAEHTGYVPVTLDPTTFQVRWNWTSTFGTGTEISPVTTGSGKVVFSVTGRFAPAFLLALNEADGTAAWQYDFGSIHRLNDPAASVGRVFVATSGHQDTAMWSFDLVSGEFKYRTPFASQWEQYLAPTFRDRTVYANGGYYGGMYAFRGSTGVEIWFAGLAQYDLWTPAIDDDYAYAHTGYEWVALDRTAGDRTFTVPNTTFNWRGYSLNIAPVIDAAGSNLVVDGVYDFDPGVQHANHLIRYSVLARGELWTVNGRFLSNPAAAAGRAYVLNAAGNRLEAYDTSNGALLWHWGPADPDDIIPVGNIVVTDNLVFFSTGTTTYAIDVDTHQSRWSAPHAGDLALSSNGVLYIVAPQRIDAYDLL